MAEQPSSWCSPSCSEFWYSFRWPGGSFRGGRPNPSGSDLLAVSGDDDIESVEFGRPLARDRIESQKGFRELVVHACREGGRDRRVRPGSRGPPPRGRDQATDTRKELTTLRPPTLSVATVRRPNCSHLGGVLLRPCDYLAPRLCGMCHVHDLLLVEIHLVHRVSVVLHCRNQCSGVSFTDDDAARALHDELLLCHVLLLFDPS